MQHYGIPTRLLDWSESHLTALYFALLNFNDIANAAVWVLMPRHLNKIVLPLTTFKSFDRTVPISSDKRLSGYTVNIEEIKRVVDEKWPLAIRPIRTSDRITSQKGMFTIHGNDKNSLNKIISDFNSKFTFQIPLFKIVIDGKFKTHILRELYAAGISHSVLFPELDGISQEIAFRYSKQFSISIDGHHFPGFR